MNKIVVITYNILSSNLAKLMIDNNSYTNEIMDDTYRFKLILDYINKQIIKFSKYNLIICLQEVIEEQIILFAEFFNKNNFKYINIQHGRVFNGNMGVLIAYTDRLKIINSDIFNVGQHIDPIDDISTKASTKSNCAIYCIFESIKKSDLRFGIITYHMPCEPTIQEIALLHCKTLYAHIKKFMKGINWIFAGDFNMMNDALGYKYLSTRKDIGCIWKDTLNYYPITNHALISNKEFAGCIDYIFYKKGNQLKNKKYIKYRKSNLICQKIKVNKLINVIPDLDNPSDHIPILVIFTLD